MKRTRRALGKTFHRDWTTEGTGVSKRSVRGNGLYFREVINEEMQRVLRQRDHQDLKKAQ